MYEVTLFTHVQLKLVSGFPGELASGEVCTASWDAFCITHCHNMPFQCAVSELCVREPSISVYLFLRLLTSHCCAC